MIKVAKTLYTYRVLGKLLKVVQLYFFSKNTSLAYSTV